MKSVMKKLAAMGITLAMVASLAACGGNNENASADESTAADSTQATVEYTGEDQPGFGVYYREGDPEADADIEVTSTDSVVWTVANCTTEDNPQAVALADLAAELEEKTNGNFTLDIFYNSELGSEGEAVELCRNNTVQFVTSNVTSMPTYLEETGVFALPYLFHSSADELEYLATSDVSHEMWKQLEESSNLVTMGFDCAGARCLSTTGVENVKAPADLKGTKVRCMDAQVWQDVISALGATPVPIAYTELYTALQTNVVSGQDNPASNTVDGKFYEVLDTFYETNHCYLVSGFYSNTDAWDALPDDYKAVFQGLLQKYLGNEYSVLIDEFQEECYATMEDAGVAIVPQDELDMDAFYSEANKMIESKYMSNEAYANIINDVNSTFGY